MSVSNSLVSDGRASGFYEAIRLLRVRGKMKVREEDLVFSQLNPFGRLRLLDFHDHLSGREYLSSRLRNRRASLTITIVSST
ncbi:hypothetical protein N0U24_22205, partial [Peribacillus frigoritolerans]|nr:hypothetical protein [Peribacillus frigoritolerans]